MTDSVSEFPYPMTLEGRTQGDTREFWLMAVDHQQPERQRKILNEAVIFGFLERMDADIFIDALGIDTSRQYSKEILK